MYIYTHVSRSLFKDLGIPYMRCHYVPLAPIMENSGSSGKSLLWGFANCSHLSNWPLGPEVVVYTQSPTLTVSGSKNSEGYKANQLVVEGVLSFSLGEVFESVFCRQKMELNHIFHEPELRGALEGLLRVKYSENFPQGQVAVRKVQGSGGYMKPRTEGKLEGWFNLVNPENALSQKGRHLTKLSSSGISLVVKKDPERKHQLVWACSQHERDSATMQERPRASPGGSGLKNLPASTGWAWPWVGKIL